MKFDIYPDRGDKYRWRLVACNGRVVACSGESFHSESNARRAAWALRNSFLNHQPKPPEPKR